MKHKILIVVDAQNDFIDGSLANPVAQERIPNLVSKIQNFDGDYIFVTRDTHTNNYLSTQEGQKLPVVHCVRGTDGWNINPKVGNALIDADVREKCKVEYVDKPTFGSDKLAHMISEIKGDLDIEIIGFCTDICVVSNAMLIKTEVYDRADITVDASCCAGVTPETHTAALETMKMCQINVINE